MKALIIALFSCCQCFAQNSKDNYIVSNNYANEAEYWFHEGDYDSAIYYYEIAFNYAKEPHPMQHYKYAKALWKMNQPKKAIKEIRLNKGVSKIDTNWFSGLKHSEYESINAKLKKNNDENLRIQFYVHFMDSIMELDQLIRQNYDYSDSIQMLRFIAQDNSNGDAVINFTLKHGFPLGKNAGWNQSAATFLLHMSPEWFVENYTLLYNEVKKGNIEPWMFARGIDRMFTVEIGEDKINPFNCYWQKSIINPFLMFNNCVSLGVSPYYNYNYRNNPDKTIHFEYYKENKQFYNTTVLCPTKN